MSKFEHQIDLLRQDVTARKIDVQFSEMCMDYFEIEIEDYLDFKKVIREQKEIIKDNVQAIRYLASTSTLDVYFSNVHILGVSSAESFRRANLIKQFADTLRHKKDVLK